MRQSKTIDHLPRQIEYSKTFWSLFKKRYTYEFINTKSKLFNLLFVRKRLPFSYLVTYLDLICVYKSYVTCRESSRHEDDSPQPQRNEAHDINNVSMVATPSETTQGNTNPANVSNTLPSCPTGVNPMAEPNLCSMDPTTVAMLEKSPLQTDTDDPPQHSPVHPPDMAVAPADMTPQYPESW